MVGRSTAEPVDLRPAKPEDLDALIEIQHSDPAPEIVGLAGSIERARRLGRAITAADGVSDPARPIMVLSVAEEPAAFIQYSVGPSESGAFGPALALGVARALGPRLFALPRRLRARRSVTLTVPAASMYIAELHVHPRHRGRGLGSQLLDWSLDRSRELGQPQRSLIAGTGNPAIRLYERHGFAILATATDASYARFFGQSGRVLMTAE